MRKEKNKIREEEYLYGGSESEKVVEIPFSSGRIKVATKALIPEYASTTGTRSTDNVVEHHARLQVS